MERKLIKIPFNLKLAKLIHSNSIPGRIIVDGYDVRVLCFDRLGASYPIVVLIRNSKDKETIVNYNEKGENSNEFYPYSPLELEVPIYLTYKNGDIISHRLENIECITVFNKYNIIGNNISYTDYVTLYYDVRKLKNLELKFKNEFWDLSGTKLSNGSDIKLLINELKLNSNPMSEEILSKFLDTRKFNKGDIVRYLNIKGKPDRSNSEYIIKYICKMKDPSTREWIEGVIYEDIVNHSIYVRESKDFSENFEIVL